MQDYVTHGNNKILTTTILYNTAAFERKGICEWVYNFLNLQYTVYKITDRLKEH